MRAVFVLLLALVALAFLAPTASAAAPPKNYTNIAIYNDSACTLPVEELQIPLDLSAKCVVQEGGRNQSWAFGCSATQNQTDALWLVYNGTTCDGHPDFLWATTGPAGGCNLMTFVYSGGKVATMYGYTTCAASKRSPLDAMLDITNRYGLSLPQPATAEEPKKEQAPQQPERTFFKRLRRGDKQDA